MLRLTSRDENLETFVFSKRLILKHYFKGVQVKVIKFSTFVSCGRFK